MIKTQEELILNHLYSGRSITPLESLQMYGIMRLASRISDIRKKYPDMNIQVGTVHNKENGKHYASYKLVIQEKQLNFA
jgi:hypothetical protein